jgi:hypothetical protein
VSAATSVSSRTRSRKLQHEPQFTQDPKSGMDTDMEEAVVEGPGLEVPVALASEPGPQALVIEGSSAIEMDDANFVYDRT